MTEEKQPDYPDHGDEEKAALTTKNEEKEAETMNTTLPDENMDSSKVKFINGGAADAFVEINDSDDQAFVGLTKEELMKYADDPYWKKVRLVLLVLFALIWFAMLGAAIVIIIVAPKCPPRPNLDWWQKSVVYEVYPRSLKDTDGNGVGDLRGVEQSLDYMRNTLNVTAVWMTPVYESPMKDFGYDISDYKQIDPLFGNMADFDALRRAMHKRGMKLIMDFVPNHTSMNHTWFEQSRTKNDDYADYYIWKDAKNGKEPNNWQSVFGGSAWTWDEGRQQYYFHQFLPEMPDLNLRNPKVQEELKEVLRFWLEKGVDGFRVDAAAHLFEAENTDQDQPDGQHPYTQFQPESYNIVADWKDFLIKFQEEFAQRTSSKYVKTRLLIVEAYGTPKQVVPFYGEWNRTGADMPYNMALVELKQGCNGHCVYRLVHEWMTAMPADKWCNWVVGNHDVARVASRMGREYVNAVNMLLMLLPGTPTTYYGEEIGMVNGNITTAIDPRGKRMGIEYSRDPYRTPMQWSGTKKNAGFSEADKTWLPVNADFGTVNVNTQQAHGGGHSNLELYTSLTLLRQRESFQWGTFHYNQTDNSVFSFVRHAQGFDAFLVAINFGPTKATIDFHAARPDVVPRRGIIVANTQNVAGHGRSEELAIGMEVSLDNIHLWPSEGVVFQWASGAAQVTE